jgi:hypothetical protein
MSESLQSCICSDWPDRTIINLGSETATLLDDHFDRLRDRSPWIYLVKCRGCQQHWYAAVDTVDDDYYFRRLSSAEVDCIVERNEWPADFDNVVNVWPLEGTQGYQARLLRPWTSEPFEPR